MGLATQDIPVDPRQRLPRLPNMAGAVRSRAFLWRRRVATIATAALAMVMAYGVVFGHNGLTAFAHKREEARSLQQQRDQLQQENERLRGHVDRLKNDPAAIEHEARADLHLTRSDEIIIVTTRPGASTQPSATPDPTR